MFCEHFIAYSLSFLQTSFGIGWQNTALQERPLKMKKVNLADMWARKFRILIVHPKGRSLPSRKNLENLKTFQPIIVSGSYFFIWKIEFFTLYFTYISWCVVCTSMELELVLFSDGIVSLQCELQSISNNVSVPSFCFLKVFYYVIYWHCISILDLMSASAAWHYQEVHFYLH